MVSGPRPGRPHPRSQALRPQRLRGRADRSPGRAEVPRVSRPPPQQDLLDPAPAPAGLRDVGQRRLRPALRRRRRRHPRPDPRGRPRRAFGRPRLRQFEKRRRPAQPLSAAAVDAALPPAADRRAAACRPLWRLFLRAEPRRSLEAPGSHPGGFRQHPHQGAPGVCRPAGFARLSRHAEGQGAQARHRRPGRMAGRHRRRHHGAPLRRGARRHLHPGRRGLRLHHAGGDAVGQAGDHRAGCRRPAGVHPGRQGRVRHPGGSGEPGGRHGPAGRRPRPRRATRPGRLGQIPRRQYRLGQGGRDADRAADRLGAEGDRRRPAAVGRGIARRDRQRPCPSVGGQRGARDRKSAEPAGRPEKTGKAAFAAKTQKAALCRHGRAARRLPFLHDRDRRGPRHRGTRRLFRHALAPLHGDAGAGPGKTRPPGARRRRLPALPVPGAACRKHALAQAGRHLGGTAAVCADRAQPLGRPSRLLDRAEASQCRAPADAVRGRQLRPRARHGNFRALRAQPALFPARGLSRAGAGRKTDPDHAKRRQPSRRAQGDRGAGALLLWPVHPDRRRLRPPQPRIHPARSRRARRGGRLQYPQAAHRGCL